MDLLIQEKAMCLGGPNFNRASVEDSALIALGFDEVERNLAQKVVCKMIEDGWSERILKRKLILADISLSLNNIGFTPIFSVIFRKNLLDYCQYLHPAQLIGWLWDSQKTNGAMYSGCVNFVQEARSETISPRCPALPLMSDKEYAGDDCMLGNLTGLNYMPYRIRLPPRKGGLCLTAARANETDPYTLSFTPCIPLDSYQVEPRIRHAYSITQLFRFHPEDTKPQRIGFLDYRKSKTDSWMCLSDFMIKTPYEAEVDNAHTQSRAVLEMCDKNKNHQFMKIIAKVRKQLNKKRQSRQQFPPKLLSIAGNGTCLSYERSPAGLLAAALWTECRQGPRKMGESSVGQQFLLERTSVAYLQ